MILKTGRFIPAAAGEDYAARMRAMEQYLTRLTEELELLIDEVDVRLRAAAPETADE